jgi:hypothetical protein
MVLTRFVSVRVGAESSENRPQEVAFGRKGCWERRMGMRADEAFARGEGAGGEDGGDRVRRRLCGRRRRGAISLTLTMTFGLF